MYRHNKYDNSNAEKEINRLKEEIRQLVMTNNAKISLLKDMEDIKNK